MTLLTVRQAWESYRDAVIPKDAPEVQLIETRRAFYAGCWSMMTSFREIGTDAVTEAAGVEYMESLYHEFREFNSLVKGGAA